MTLEGIIDHAIPAHKHTPMYLMHKYWARKPSNVVNEYVFTYAREGETVLDPFNGSGVTVLEAIKLNRKAIGVDVDPVSKFLTEATAVNIDIDELVKTFEKIKENVFDEIEKYYITTCQHCKKKSRILQILIQDGEPWKIFHDCSTCKKKDTKTFDENDSKNLKKIDKMQIPYWVPEVELIHNSRINIHKGMKYTDLFSHRNLIALSIIFNEIEKVHNKNLQLVLKLAFSGSLAQCSKLLVRTPGQGPGWKIRGFWIPPNRYEMNVWHYFENRVKKVLKGKEESNKLIGGRDKNLEIFQRSATDLSFLDDNSIDYIFTDPPYGDSVPYLELNIFWSAWLKQKGLFDDEIIISDSPVRREKNKENYAKLIRIAYKELYRVLKPGKYRTLTFHNTDIFLYNLMIRAAVITGFELQKSVYQPPATISAKAQLAPYGSAVGDYYIRFQKPMSFGSKKLISTEQLDEQIYENIIVQSVKKIIAERGEPTAYPHVINSYSIISNELQKRGYLFTAESTIEDVLKKNIGTEFELVGDKKNLWWFKDPNAVKFLDRVPLTERVESTVVNRLSGYERVSYDDILQSVYLTFPNALTPDTSAILPVLNEYAEKTSDGKWRAKLIVKNRISQHDTIVNDLCKLGEKCGFDVYGDTDEYRKNIEFDVDPHALSRIKEIDAIWYCNNKIDTIFEVEHTTGITEAIVRGSNIDYKVTKIIVIPDEREKKLARKVNEPFLHERLQKDPWLFIRYDAFLAFYEKNRRKKRIEPKQLFDLHKPPTIDSEIQKILKDFETEFSSTS